MSKPEHASPDSLHALFLKVILPRVQLHARIYFRHVKCPLQRADYVAEAIGLAWKWFVSLAEKGKDACQFPTVLATFAARAVRSGRRVVGQERANDVLSPTAQQRRGFVVEKLPDVSTLHGSPLDEALHDNVVSPIPDQVAFKIDFPCWLGSLGQRNRELAEDMALGHRTLDLAEKFRVSPGRISQMRHSFERDWSLFCADSADGANGAD